VNDGPDIKTETIEEVVIVEEHIEPVKKSERAPLNQRRRTTCGGHTRKSSLIYRETRTTDGGVVRGGRNKKGVNMNNSSLKAISFNVPKLKVNSKDITTKRPSNENIENAPRSLNWF
jgi:hypothetical protein